MYNEGLIKIWDNPELVNYWGGKNSSKKSSNANFMNIITHRNWFERLRLIYISIFEWDNLPDDIEGEWIENQLFEKGQIAFFKTGDKTSPVDTCLVLPYSNSGKVNIYGKPDFVIASGKTSTKFKLKHGDYINIKANTSAHAPIETAMLYAYRMAKVERSLDVNINNQKFPFVFKGSEDQKLSIMNFMQGFEDNETFFIVDEEFNPVGENKFDIFNTNAPYVADKLMLYKHDILNEWLTFCGLSNANTDKKERLIVDEVNANIEEVKLGVSTGLNTRQDAVNAINLKYGLNITVKERNLSEIDFGYDMETENEDIRGDNNE